MPDTLETIIYGSTLGASVMAVSTVNIIVCHAPGLSFPAMLALNFGSFFLSFIVFFIVSMWIVIKVSKRR